MLSVRRVRGLSGAENRMLFALDRERSWDLSPHNNDAELRLPRRLIQWEVYVIPVRRTAPLLAAVPTTHTAGDKNFSDKTNNGTARQMSSQPLQPTNQPMNVSGSTRNRHLSKG